MVQCCDAAAVRQCDGSCAEQSCEGMNRKLLIGRTDAARRTVRVRPVPLPQHGCSAHPQYHPRARAGSRPGCRGRTSWQAVRLDCAPRWQPPPGAAEPRAAGPAAHEPAMCDGKRWLPCTITAHPRTSACFCAIRVLDMNPPIKCARFLHSSPTLSMPLGRDDYHSVRCVPCCSAAVLCRADCRGWAQVWLQLLLGAPRHILCCRHHRDCLPVLWLCAHRAVLQVDWPHCCRIPHPDPEHLHRVCHLR